jgi:hypothetical protein
VVVVWRDCDFTFVDGVLDAIAPYDGGRTIDGIASGSKVSDAVTFYGQPLGPVEKDSGSDWLTFLADEAKGAAYRMAVEGYGAGPVGTITRIVLCHCMPHHDVPPVATSTVGCENETLLPLLLASGDVDQAISLWGPPELGEPQCDGEWAMAPTTYTSPGAQNVEVLFHRIDGVWRYVTLGGNWDCVGQNGVPADVAAKFPGCH